MAEATDGTKLCFFISPIGERDSTERDHSDQVMKLLLKRVTEDHGYRLERADQINDEGRIDDHVLDRLITADLAVADLTGLNPNVMYELGARHALGGPTIVIANDGTVLPFDAVALRTVFYSLDDVVRFKESEEELERAIEAIDAGGVSTNPVSERMSRNHLQQSTQALDVAVAHLGAQMDRALLLLEDREQGLMDARFAFHNRNYEEALRLFESFLVEHPTHTEGLIGLAKTQKRRDMLPEAIDSLNRLLEAKPNIAQAVYNRACYKANAGYPPEEVAADLSDAIRLAARYERYARSDPDFGKYRDYDEFRRLIGE